MSTRVDAVSAETGYAWPTIVAFVGLVAAFTIVAGPIGLLAGLVTALAGYALGTPYALAVGHILLVVATPEGIAPLSIALVEVAFVAVLLAPLLRTASSGRTVFVAVTSALALAGTARLVTRSQPTWLAATTVLVLLAVASYGLHRLALVRLGLVPASDDGDALPTDRTESTSDPATESTET